MTFEEVLKQLNGRQIFLENLTQLEDGKSWSCGLRKKGDFTHGYGQGKTIEKAVQAGLVHLRSQLTDKQWKEFAKNQSPPPKKKKRVRMKGK